MSTSQMTFHESYGSLPMKTLRLIRKYNVSPADFDMMLDSLMFTSNPEVDQSEGAVAADWWDVDHHIVSNSETGMYRPNFF